MLQTAPAQRSRVGLLARHGSAAAKGLVALGIALAAGSAPSGARGDWPAFRGPTGDGHSQERGLPLEWSESRNVVWKAPIPGRGWSSPAVAGDRVWLTTVEGGRG